jgi:quinohemoprotein amine dehydrogenase
MTGRSRRLFSIARSALASAAVLIAAPAAAQNPPAAPTAPPARNAAADADAGIPVQNDLVRARCGGCHRSDAKGRMTRISYRRATPENWEKTIKRMVALNNARLEPADARTILKYLADHQGLAPEETRTIAFEAERRMVDFTYAADKETADLCSSCHSIARVLSERRTKEEWELLLSMHRGYYPLVDNQPMVPTGGFRRTRPPQTEPGADGRPPDNRHPMDRALEHLTKALPLTTSDWSAWSAAMQPPKLAGKWALIGSQPGKGPVFGQVTVAVDPASPDSFTTETRYTIARTGETVTRSGRGLVYTGYQWRGRGTIGSTTWREVLFVERDWKNMWGRWYTGDYDETGIDVKLVRLAGDPVVFGTSSAALKTSSAGQSLTIYGANLPADITPADVGLGQGVTITRVTGARPDEVTLEVDVAATAPIGVRDLSIAGTVRPSALVVYDRIDGIKVTPISGMARVGGAVFPKQLQQFDAVGYNNGPDGKPDTADDLDLGAVPVKWSLEEYTATFADDDLQYVGAIDQNGLFTPALDGPNPKRAGNRNNIGDVWVVAEMNGTAPSARPLRARAHLLVTVPLYMAWFQDEAAK